MAARRRVGELRALLQRNAAARRDIAERLLTPEQESAARAELERLRVRIAENREWREHLNRLADADDRFLRELDSLGQDHPEAFEGIVGRRRRRRHAGIQGRAAPPS